MSFEYDPSDVPESMDSFDVVPAGEYHFQVVEAFEDEKGQLVVDAKVLAGRPDGQQGKSHREYFASPKPDQAPEKRVHTAKRQLTYFIATGLTSEEELKAAKTAGRKVNLDPALTNGRQFCAKLTAKEYEGKVSQKMGYDIWPVNSEKAAGIPLDAAMLEKDGEAPAGQDDPYGDVF